MTHVERLSSGAIDTTPMRIAGMLLLSGLTLATAAEMGRGAPALMRDSTTHALPDGERRMSGLHLRKKAAVEKDAKHVDA